MRIHAARLLARILLALACCLGAAPTAWAADLVVNDLTDADVDDGLCLLREAITAANNDDDYHGCTGTDYGADTIRFNDGGIILLDNTLPPITDPAGLIIDGSDTEPGVTVSGQDAVRVMVVHEEAKLELRYLTVANGNTTGSGGGIFNDGSLAITHSTFADNRAGQGGGIQNFGPLTVTNSTFSGNHASHLGGGIMNAEPLTLTYSTFWGNSAAVGGGLYNASCCTLTLAYTILAHSTGGDCVNDSGTVTIGGINHIMEDGGCDPNALIDDPRLGDLTDNDGPTLTHALLPGSPAIDAVPEDQCPPPATDQRGMPSPQGKACDIGAYEQGFSFAGFFLPVGNPPTVNTVKAGQGILVKFSLEGDRGFTIFAAGYPASRSVACDTNSPLNAVEEAVSAGASGLQYDPASDTYTYVWKTSKGWAGTCRELVVRFSDTTERTALFQFK